MPLATETPGGKMADDESATGSLGARAARGGSRGNFRRLTNYLLPPSNSSRAQYRHSLSPHSSVVPLDLSSPLFLFTLRHFWFRSRQPKGHLHVCPLLAIQKPPEQCAWCVLRVELCKLRVGAVHIVLIALFGSSVPPCLVSPSSLFSPRLVAVSGCSHSTLLLHIFFWCTSSSGCTAHPHPQY